MKDNAVKGLRKKMGWPVAKREDGDDRWATMTEQVLAGIDDCDPLYRPTNFWGPGVDRILGDIRDRGFERFKAWPSAASWFYPRYGDGFAGARMNEMMAAFAELRPDITENRVRTILGGSLEARRDFHAVQLAWDQERWPFDLLSFGESEIGGPQRFRLAKTDVGWTRPYLNYLLCLTALSRHVEAPPRSFLEIGGGFGVLGEIVTQRDPEARYVDADIPPLVVIAAWYLDQVGPGAVTMPNDLPEGPFEIDAVGTLPSWRLPDLRTDFEVFVNSFSFQEMEPDVVANYARIVASRGVEYVVSLNSRGGKRRATAGTEGGAIEPVTSQFIVDSFAEHGFEVAGRYGEPLVQSAGELVVLRRK
ncbi:hypothetical protein ASE01_06905 [Nocardioides sp. Root190]|uniref:putative sugar O-methyltransferase n=1 Tax=Nocardioides sp. Root190 TaxID=1736488 RepID=UPI0006F7C461|nr:putative sugar O-methyltransferase [Nocardioides sp. Root190]KRB77904.1 hypothetical protein ASE01_06905 [Nocardioides sp. Root190]